MAYLLMQMAYLFLLQFSLNFKKLQLVVCKKTYLTTTKDMAGENQVIIMIS